MQALSAVGYSANLPIKGTLKKREAGGGDIGRSQKIKFEYSMRLLIRELVGDCQGVFFSFPFHFLLFHFCVFEPFHHAMGRRGGGGAGETCPPIVPIIVAKRTPQRSATHIKCSIIYCVTISTIYVTYYKQCQTYQT